MIEHLPLELLQFRAWFEAELVPEQRASFAEGGEGIGLSAGAVQGEHQLRTWTLAQRLRANERFELRNELRARAPVELLIEELLQRRQT